MRCRTRLVNMRPLFKLVPMFPASSPRHVAVSSPWSQVAHWYEFNGLSAVYLLTMIQLVMVYARRMHNELRCWSQNRKCAYANHFRHHSLTRNAYWSWGRWLSDSSLRFEWRHTAVLVTDILVSQPPRHFFFLIVYFLLLLLLFFFFRFPCFL
jgi:hypothetical protein